MLLSCTPVVWTPLYPSSLLCTVSTGWNSECILSPGVHQGQRSFISSAVISPAGAQPNGFRGVLFIFSCTTDRTNRKGWELLTTTLFVFYLSRRMKVLLGWKERKKEKKSECSSHVPKVLDGEVTLCLSVYSVHSAAIIRFRCVWICSSTTSVLHWTPPWFWPFDFNWGCLLISNLIYEFELR